MSATACRDFTIGGLHRLTGQKGFQGLPRRRVVERTSGWMMRRRRIMHIYLAETFLYIIN